MMKQWSCLCTQGFCTDWPSIALLLTVVYGAMWEKQSYCSVLHRWVCKGTNKQYFRKVKNNEIVTFLSIQKINQVCILSHDYTFTAFLGQFHAVFVTCSKTVFLNIKWLLILLPYFKLCWSLTTFHKTRVSPLVVDWYLFKAQTRISAINFDVNNKLSI
jgi:hypothetical protein